jgi:hypothetical protein
VDGRHDLGILEKLMLKVVIEPGNVGTPLGQTNAAGHAVHQFEHAVEPTVDGGLVFHRRDVQVNFASSIHFFSDCCKNSFSVSRSASTCISTAQALRALALCGEVPKLTGDSP